MKSTPPTAFAAAMTFPAYSAFCSGAKECAIRTRCGSGDEERGWGKRRERERRDYKV